MFKMTSRGALRRMETNDRKFLFVARRMHCYLRYQHSGRRLRHPHRTVNAMFQKCSFVCRRGLVDHVVPSILSEKVVSATSDGKGINAGAQTKQNERKISVESTLSMRERP